MTTVLGECRSRLDFYQLVFQAKVNALDFREVDYGERQINGSTFYYSTYEYFNRKGKKKYWSFSSLVDTHSYKILCLSQMEANSPKQSLYDAMGRTRCTEYKYHLSAEVQQTNPKTLFYQLLRRESYFSILSQFGSYVTEMMP